MPDAEKNIPVDAYRKDDGLLKNNSHPRTKGIHICIRRKDGTVVQKNIPFDSKTRIEVHKAVEASQECALSRAGRANNAKDLARRDAQIYPS
jgi:hypothetical protein